jgi:hypothetical protein
LSNGQAKDSNNSWKSKALHRGQENRILKKRLSEVTQSRDCWRNKYFVGKQKSPSKENLEGTRAKFHQYSLQLVGLMLEMQRYGSLSLRACRHCLGCMLLSMGLRGRLPSHSSLRNWSCKHGYHRLLSSQHQGGEYVVFVDESIVFGSEKILLILGVSKDKIPLDRALVHSDLDVLYVGFDNQWKAESIEAELQKIAKNKVISYVVSDEGLNLCKAYKACNHVHIEDCTHIFANYLKKIYSEDDTFEGFRKLIGKLRQAWNLSQANSQYMPPSMRGKMRFANIFPCITWANSCLDKWNTLDEKVQESLAFLRQHQGFIEDLVQIGTIFKSVCKTLKTEGFGVKQKETILAELSKIKAAGNTIIFIQNVKDYLENLSQKRNELSQDHLLCSSDIIESYFGKFKYKTNPNSRSGLTEFIFTMANFSGNFSENEIKNALEQIKIKDLKQAKLKAKAP